MKKILVAALAAYAGLGMQVWGQDGYPTAVSIVDREIPVSTTKLGLLNISLKNQYQAYDTGKKQNPWGVTINPPDPLETDHPNRDWTITSYDYLARCVGTVIYATKTKTVDNKSILRAINAAFRRTPVGEVEGDRLPGIFVNAGSPYLGSFTTSAKIVVVNYENLRHLPPYPPTIDNYYNPYVNYATVWNAPWVLNDSPYLANDGEQIPPAPDTLFWPNQNYISWGKPDPSAEGFSWVGTRVFVIDPKNVNENLRCFDVTPFFAFEEGYCKFCWDTHDRITDGSITKTPEIWETDPPCSIFIEGEDCGTKGSGVTKFYWTVKFNNVGAPWARNPNYLLERYYLAYLQFDPAWGEIYGARLDDAGGIQQSFDSLAFTVGGVATYNSPTSPYKWKFKKLSDGFSWPMGKFSMSSAGFGYSPMCGVFSGPVSMTEFDKADKQFGGKWCLTP